MQTKTLKMTMTHTLKSKAQEALTIETKTKMEGVDMDLPPTSRDIKKVAPLNKDEKCPSCGKAASLHGSSNTSGKEKIKIGDKEIQVTLVDSTSIDCEGKVVGKSKMKFSDEVPGGIVSLESENASGKTTMNCITFSKGSK
jgi:hypothetical protein